MLYCTLELTNKNECNQICRVQKVRTTQNLKQFDISGLCHRSGRGGRIGQRHLKEHSGALVQQRLEAHVWYVQVEHESLEVLRVRALSARELERDRHRAAIRPLPLRVRLLLLDVTHETSGGDEREELQKEHRVVLVDRAASRPDALRVLTRQLTEFSCLVGAAYRCPARVGERREHCARKRGTRGGRLVAARALLTAPERRVVRLVRQHRHADRLGELLQRVRRVRPGSTGSTADRRGCWVATVRVRVRARKTPWSTSRSRCSTRRGRGPAPAARYIVSSIVNYRLWDHLRKF